MTVIQAGPLDTDGVGEVGGCRWFNIGLGIGCRVGMRGCLWAGIDAPVRREGVVEGMVVIGESGARCRRGVGPRRRGRVSLRSLQYAMGREKNGGSGSEKGKLLKGRRGGTHRTG